MLAGAVTTEGQSQSFPPASQTVGRMRIWRGDGASFGTLATDVFELSHLPLGLICTNEAVRNAHPDLKFLWMDWDGAFAQPTGKVQGLTNRRTPQHDRLMIDHSYARLRREALIDS